MTNQSLALGFAKTGGDQAGPTLTWTGSVTRDGLPFADLTTTTDAATWTPRGFLRVRGRGLRTGLMLPPDPANTSYRPSSLTCYFSEVAEPGGDMKRLVQINQKYSIDMDFESVPRLCERFGLTFPELPR